MIVWTLRDHRGYPNVDDLRSSSLEEVEVALKAANTMHPDGAPHQATDEDGEVIAETEETMPRESIEEAIERASNR